MKIKRKISNYCLLLILLLIPIYAIADTCTTPGVSGSASSNAGSGPGAGGCTSAHCLASWGDVYVGIRFQIYKYDNSGKAENITLVGKGVDVWATDKFTKDSYYSNPSTPNLKKKAQCTDVNNPKYGDGHVGTHTLTLEQYLATGQVKVDTQLGKYFNGKLNSYSLTHNGNKPTGGWFAKNLLNKLIGGKENELKEVKDLFGLSDAQLTNLMNNTGNYYITAEILYRFRTSDNSHCVNYYNQCDPWRTALDKYPNKFFYGTVSENANAHGNKDIYDKLFISNGVDTAKADADVGKIVGSNYFIKKVELTDSGKAIKYNTKKKNPYIEGGDYYAKQTACNYARGYAVWNIKAICWECGYTCESACGYTPNGTQERAACAKAWCDVNKPDAKANETCFKGCTNVPTDEGCGKDEKKCSDYQSNTNIIEKKTGVCDTEINNSNKNGKTDKVSATICYDDNQSFGDNKDVQTLTQTKYYKIICEDTMELTNLPNEPKLYLTEGKTGNIHFSYAIKYNKTCKLYFKTNAEYKKLKGHSTDYWFTPTNVEQYNTYSKVKEDIKGLNTAISKAQKELNTLKEAQKLDSTNERIAKNIKINENAIKSYKSTIAELEKVYTTAMERLSTLINEKTAEKLKINEVKLKTYKYDKIKEAEDIPIDLIPITCTPTNNQSKEKFVCLINGFETDKLQTVTIGGVDYTCKGTGGTVNGSGTTRSYEEVIVYSVPDSYVSAHTNTSGSVFHSEKDCEDNVKAANGFCKVVEYGYTFPEYDGKSLENYIKEINNIPNKLTMSVAGGMCDELSYDYNCDYKVEAKYCTECDGYTEGTKEYDACYKEKCSCDAYCGSDMACRAKYCPTTCEGCNWKTVSTNCTDCSDTCDKISNKNSVEYQTCFYDECCTKKCDNNCSCIYSCCSEKCDTLYEGNDTKLKECKAVCQKQLKTCTNSGDYVYRNISLNNPFPERGTSTGNIGNNWYGKENYITNTDEDTYRDETDGKSSNFEYSVEINSKQLKEVKKAVEKNKKDESGYKDSTMFKSFGSSNTYISAIDSDAYCSKFLHEELVSIIGEGNYHETQDATMNCRTR